MTSIGVEMDPRIAERRRSVESERRHRRERWLVVGLMIVVLAVGGWMLSRSALFDVNEITVVGAQKVGAEQILGVSGLSVGDPLLWLDTSAAARRVESLPAIGAVTVTRTLSGDVTISVRERVPVAVVAGADGTAMLVDRDGAVIAPFTLEAPPVTVVEGLVAGPAGSTVEGPLGALEVAALLTPGVQSRVAVIRVDAGGDIELQLRPQGVVELGRSVDLATKVRSLLTVLGQVDQNDLATIDLRVPDTPVVTRTPE